MIELEPAVSGGIGASGQSADLSGSGGLGQRRRERGLPAALEKTRCGRRGRAALGTPWGAEAQRVLSCVGAGVSGS